ncbi:septation ring formation regulator EzrA [uncultured Sphingomonas sp.]|uniref:FtsB family cell division protein n=1 Tax=uncultured Sphingomonas sp. TaxID=158754 RepID=UPI0025F617A8|nr:septation ring formation regulator EzrA [uncultured Sphingomonas sp.]
MISRRPTLPLFKSAIGPAIALVVIAYFAGAAIVGPNGIMSLAGYKTQAREREAVLARLDSQRDLLRHHARLLAPGRVDPDYADELVRRQTGQVAPNDRIIPLD